MASSHKLQYLRPQLPSSPDSSTDIALHRLPICPVMFCYFWIEPLRDQEEPFRLQLYKVDCVRDIEKACVVCRKPTLVQQFINRNDIPFIYNRR